MSSKSKREEALNDRGLEFDVIGNHGPDCHKSHPACAYLMGWDDGEANAVSPKRMPRCLHGFQITTNEEKMCELLEKLQDILRTEKGH